MSHINDMVSMETESKAQRKVFVPNKLLECLPRSPVLPTERLRWNTNEEIASFLISFDRHDEWICCSLKTRPKNGSIILYNRKKVKYRKDGYCWKKRKDGKTTREDHMKLKVQGMECLYGCYVHSSIVPTFHRRCYWLLQNPDIVLVHYLNVPSAEDTGKCSPLVCAVSDRHSNTRWSRDDLLSQLKPMFHSMKCTVGSGDFTIEDLVQHILERQRTKPQPRTHACLCNHGSSGGNFPHRCNTKHRIISPKVDKNETKPSSIKTHSPVPSPHPPIMDSSPSPPSTAAIAVSNYTNPHSNLTAMALPQNALIVMAAAAATPPANHSANTTLSHNNNNNNKPLVVAAETVTLLPPLLLTPPPLPPQATPSPPQTTPPSPRNTPQAFDPDAFLNSPKQGQTYGRLVSNHNIARAPSPASSLSSLSSMDSAPLTADSALLGADHAPLTLCLELDGEHKTKNGSDTVEVCNGEQEPENAKAAPTKLSLIQSNCTSPRRHSSAPLLLICQDVQPANQTQPNNNNLTTFSPQTSPVQVKQESRRQSSDVVSMDMPRQRSVSMETGAVEEAELELSFDSPFPDLISDLIGEETNQTPPLVHLVLPTTPQSVSFAPPTAGVRYVVPPQPSPSTSFLPFPQPSPLSRRANITDFSPEWSYPEGGVKVLITGPWSEPSGKYSCVFDQSSVPASLIQPGVLRCYCPAHEAGLVCLQVFESGGSVSSSVLFEYRARNASSLPSSQLDWLSLDDNQFRMSILERLEQMERRMAHMSSRENQQQSHHQGEQLKTGPANIHALPAAPLLPSLPDQAQWFERRIVGLCQWLMSSPFWRTHTEGGASTARAVAIKGGGAAKGGGDRLHRSVRHRGMTLLHLAAAQGYTHLILTLRHWRSLNCDSLELEQEVDPLNVDHFSCTPLMWACALGHQESAELLYSWNGAALGIPDSLGRLPLAVARSRGHTRLATALELLHTSGQRQREGGQRLGEGGQRQGPKFETNNHKSQGNQPTTEEQTTRKRSSGDQQNGLEKQHKAEENTEEQRRCREERRCSEERRWCSEERCSEEQGRHSTVQRRSSEERRCTEEERKHSEEEQRRCTEEERKRSEEEQRKHSEEEQRKHSEEEERKRSEEEQRRLGEERRFTDKERKRSEERRCTDEERKCSEEEQRRRSEERRCTDEERRHSEEEQRRRSEERRCNDGERKYSEEEEEEEGSISVDLEEPHMTLSDPGDSPRVLSPLSTSPDTGLSSSSSLLSPSPFDPASSPSLSSAYSSVGPTPMDTSPPESPSTSPALLWGTESHLMEYESSAPPPLVHAPGRLAHASLQQLLGLNQSLSESLSQSLGHSLSQSLGHSLSQSLGHSLSQSLGHSLSQSLGHSLSQSLGHSLSENNENEELLEDDELQVDVAALAEQIIEATPERIKREDFPRGAESPLRERQENPDLQDTWLAAYLETVDPPRRLCPPSPLSALALHRLRPPSSAAWAEFLNASANGKIERDFALLTLTDGEQRELYEAARIIQTAFRRYKGRRLKEQQDMAAAVIQRCYRKYKQFALYKKMTQAAILIQSKFRSYYEQKRFQQSRRAAVLIQQYYRSYKSSRGSFLTKKQDQAARKIMRFLRRCRHRIKELKQSRELERRGLTT